MVETPDTEAARGGREALVADELLDDVSLENRGDDRFELVHFVDELADVCRLVKPPANIALFGSWGSGKSSARNLLEKLFEKDDAVAFAWVDALKYSEQPLRRHLISQLEKQLAPGLKISEQLYQTETTTNLEVSPADLRRFLTYALGVLVVAVTLVGLIAALIAAADPGPFRQAFVTTARSGLTTVVLSTAIVTTILAAAGKFFDFTTTRSAPSSEEQFESLFIDIVTHATKGGGKRVVIFIDELDRCRPTQVASVLEILRTFLEVEPCVFVVAADQYVLEHALNEAVQQATPVDSANPYYSSGSAYLDKVFGYQFSLPPLSARRLKDFAIGLTDGRPGTWQRLSRRTEVISVLVPSHVTNPRRVKVLLNNFVLTYRIALDRVADGKLDDVLDERVEELAKLVCLRTEFPLFARDLQLDHRLPEITLEWHVRGEVDEDKWPGVLPEVVQRAEAYAQGKLPVDLLLTDPPPTDDVAAEDELENALVRQRHRTQLVRYLMRTQHVATPGRDLIFLESPGSSFGLPAEVVQRLELDAVDGQHRAVVNTIRRLSEPGARDAAIDLLTDELREAIGTTDVQNVATCLLRATSATSIDTGRARRVIQSLRRHGFDLALSDGDLQAALNLVTIVGPRVESNELAMEILKRDLTRTDPGLGARAVRSSRAFGRSVLPEVGRVVAALIAAGHDDEMWSAVSDLDDKVAVPIVKSAGEHVAELAMAAGEADDQGAEAEDESA